MQECNFLLVKFFAKCCECGSGGMPGAADSAVAPAQAAGEQRKHGAQCGQRGLGKTGGGNGAGAEMGTGCSVHGWAVRLGLSGAVAGQRSLSPLQRGRQRDKRGPGASAGGTAQARRAVRPTRLEHKGRGKRGNGGNGDRLLCPRVGGASGFERCGGGTEKPVPIAKGGGSVTNAAPAQAPGELREHRGVGASAGGTAQATRPRRKRRGNNASSALTKQAPGGNARAAGMRGSGSLAPARQQCAEAES
jgi:hypothetical protein